MTSVTSDQKAAKSATSLPSTSNQKASLFNLIIYTHEPRRAAYFQDIVRMITSQFPCRVIFIYGDEEASEPYLRVKLSPSNEAANALINDQIYIEAGGAHLKRVPFIILPYLIADLPIYLLWGQDPTTEHAVLPHLQKYATRLIFDSECSENLQCFSKSILSYVNLNQREITDMNWARIRSWREVLTQTFDTQERIDQLNNSKNIKIVYNNRSSDLSLNPETQAFYLQAWLATQLKWNFEKIEKSDQAILIHYRSATSSILVQLEGEKRDQLPPEEIIGFEASNDENFLISLSRKGTDQIIVHCSTIDRCELPFTLQLANIWSGRSFMQEIFYKKTSNQYFNMLKLIGLITRDSI